MKLYMLIGPPGSGKSTWRAKNTTPSTVVISTDDWIEQFARDNGCSYSDAFNMGVMGDATKFMHELFLQAVQAGDDIIVDRTNMSVKSRQFWLQNSTGYEHIAVMFNNIDREVLDHRLEDRYNNTGKFIPPDVVDSMIRSFQPPQKNEFDQVVDGSNG